MLPELRNPDDAVRPEPGSFRDPANRVFYANSQVLRGLGPQAAEDWRALAGSSFFPALLAAGKVCGTEPADSAVVPD
ncbi:MAG TPA: methyltransferase, partial [Micromonospora sp.]